MIENRPIVLEEIAQGIKGRKLPKGEGEVTRESIENFIKRSGNSTDDAWASWVRNLYFPQKQNSPIKKFINSFFE